VVNYASSKEDADRVVSSIAEQGGKAFAAQGDVSKSDDVKQLFAEVAHEFSGLDVLVNNAGVYSFGPLESVTETEFHRQYTTNVLGTLLATQEAVKLFGEKGGSIINIRNRRHAESWSGHGSVSSNQGLLDRRGFLLRKITTRDCPAISWVAGFLCAEFVLNRIHPAGIPQRVCDRQQACQTIIGQSTQRIARTTPPSTRSAAPFVAEESSPAR